MTVVYAPELPELEGAECGRCYGDGYLDHGHGPDEEPKECPECGGCGEVEVCPNCKERPWVENGLEACGCTVAVLALPEVAA